MWVPQTENWNASYTDLSKYFIEKVKQRVDHEEVISNRHRTTNGYTMVAEISEVCRQTLLRTKSSRRLQVLLNEAKEVMLKCNIANDYILNKYFSDIVVYYKKVDTSNIQTSDTIIKTIKLKSEILFARLKQYYFFYLKRELEAIDLTSDKFMRNANLLDNLIDCLVPYLLFEGYSTDSISTVLYRYHNSKDNASVIKKFLSLFNGKARVYSFIVVDIVNDPSHDAFREYLEDAELNYTIEDFSSVKNDLSASYTVADESKVYRIEHSTVDPNTFLRTIYEKGFKHYISSKERVSLPFFSNYFKNSFWKFKNGQGAYIATNSKQDPLNVSSRASTLRSTLKLIAQSGDISYSDENGLRYIKSIREPLFYYNLALGSKSIENSLLLLWTALETLLPYRFRDNDIENVQYFVSRSLSVGAIGRQIRAFASRLIQTNSLNNNQMLGIGTEGFKTINKSEGVVNWLNWLSQKFSQDNDPYDKIKNYSVLLSKEFIHLNGLYDPSSSDVCKVDYWQEMIDNSELSIKYQLDRIYLHRNQIVHSGKFVNEYTNLWSHLEWYIGKLLAYAYIAAENDKTGKVFDKAIAFKSLESDYEQIKNIFLRNKGKLISEIQDEFPIVLKHVWQFM